MNARSVTVDFTKKSGKIKQLHGLPAGPRGGGVMLSSDLSREFLEIGVPSVRLHDVEYPYGKNQFIDIHCILKYGISLSAVAESLKKTVKYTVEDFTGMIVDTVNVHVVGVRV